MKQCKICKNPTQIHGKYMPFGGVYGKIDGYTYYVDYFQEMSIKKNILNFWVWSDEYNLWMRTSSALHPKKYDKLTMIVCKFIRKNQLYNLKQPSNYIRNAEISAAGAPKEKKAQNELIFRVANVGYALNSHVITDTDVDQKIRPGIYYYPEKRPDIY